MSSPVSLEHRVHHCVAIRSRPDDRPTVRDVARRDAVGDRGQGSRRADGVVIGSGEGRGAGDGSRAQARASVPSATAPDLLPATMRPTPRLAKRRIRSTLSRERGVSGFGGVDSSLRPKSATKPTPRSPGPSREQDRPFLGPRPIRPPTRDPSPRALPHCVCGTRVSDRKGRRPVQQGARPRGDCAPRGGSEKAPRLARGSPAFGAALRGDGRSRCDRTRGRRARRSIARREPHPVDRARSRLRDRASIRRSARGVRQSRRGCPEGPGGPEDRRDACRSLGRGGNGRASARRGASARPRDAVVWHALGLVRFDLGDLAGARSAPTKAVSSRTALRSRIESGSRRSPSKRGARPRAGRVRPRPPGATFVRRRLPGSLVGAHCARASRRSDRDSRRGTPAAARIARASIARRIPAEPRLAGDDARRAEHPDTPERVEASESTLDRLRTRTKSLVCKGL